ncbi:hypothetical protein [Streptomyces sp. CAU 1734]|uniref:hypothetical protein n=1 Tax=Streptomyces sp. CAU 1734 TaxID=3140360 RepID=UPI003260858E
MTLTAPARSGTTVAMPGPAATGYRRALVYASGAGSLHRLSVLTRAAVSSGHHILAASADAPGEPVRKRPGMRQLAGFLPSTDVLLISSEADIGDGSSERSRIRHWLARHHVAVRVLPPSPPQASPATVPDGTVPQRMCHTVIPAEHARVPALLTLTRDFLDWATPADTAPPGGLIPALNALVTHCITGLHHHTGACPRLSVTVNRLPAGVLVTVADPGTLPLDPRRPLTLPHAVAWGSRTRPGTGRRTWMRIPLTETQSPPGREQREPSSSPRH